MHQESIRCKTSCTLPSPSYNLLVLRGFKTFLDYEFREELSSLTDIVSKTTNFIFVLTDNIFSSAW